MPKDAAGQQNLPPDLIDAHNLIDAYYEFGDLGFLAAEAHEEGPGPAGTVFYGLDGVGDGRDGLLLGGQAALYGEPWASRNDPWDGP